MVHGIENWKYDDRLKFLGLTRLDKRRIRSYLVETFKILNGFYNINVDGGRRSGHEKKLLKRRFRLDTRKFVFFYRAMLSIRGTSHGPVSVCLSVRPSVRHKSEFY